MRTREEIISEFQKCDSCGRRTPNSFGECFCSYELRKTAIPLEIEILLDIRDLLIDNKKN